MASMRSSRSSRCRRAILAVSDAALAGRLAARRASQADAIAADAANEGL
jgi:hypothetical protein